MKTEIFRFDLPDELIAGYPAEPRDSARLLHVLSDGALEDKIVTDLPDLLRPDDVLVFNDKSEVKLAVALCCLEHVENF